MSFKLKGTLINREKDKTKVPNYLLVLRNDQGVVTFFGIDPDKELLKATAGVNYKVKGVGTLSTKGADFTIVADKEPEVITIPVNGEDKEFLDQKSFKVTGVEFA